MSLRFLLVAITITATLYDNNLIIRLRNNRRSSQRLVDVSSLKCSNCHTAFKTSVSLNVHTMMYHKYCNVCDAPVDSSRHIYCHDYPSAATKATGGVATMTTKSKRKAAATAQLECDQCSKSFARRDALRSHKLARHVDQALRVHYPCDRCGKTFLSRARVDVHVQRTHLKKFKFHCAQCGKGFLFLQELNRHTENVHVKTELANLIPCTYPDCGKAFKSVSSLKYHLHNHDENKETSICDQCGKLFNNPYLYKKHLRNHKVTRKVYTCRVCDKTVTSMGSLEDHMRLHSGEKPFICEHCGRGFRTRVILSAHLVVHTKEKNHVCQYCGKAFTQRSPLKTHMVKFHGDKFKSGT